MRKFVSSENRDFDPIVVQSGSSQIQDGRRKHPHIRPQIGSDEDLDDERDDAFDAREVPLDKILG